MFNRALKEPGFSLGALGDWKGAAERWAVSGPSFTLLVNGAVEGCGGIVMIDQTFGECWLLIPKSTYGVVVYRAIVKKLKSLYNEHNFRRLQAFISPGFTQGIRLVERLGFRLEGELKQYGPQGQTLCLYARTQ